MNERIMAIICMLLGWTIIVTLLTLQGCETSRPKVDVNFWAGDSKKTSITRSQNKTSIACSDPQFDQYVCINYSDFEKLMNKWDSCKEW